MTGSGFFGHDLAGAPEVDGGAVDAGGFARHQRGAAQCPAGAGQGIFLSSRFHFLDANSCGRPPELSYTRQASASGL